MQVHRNHIIRIAEDNIINISIMSGMEVHYPNNITHQHIHHIHQAYTTYTTCTTETEIDIDIDTLGRLRLPIPGGYSLPPSTT